VEYGFNFRKEVWAGDSTTLFALPFIGQLTENPLRFRKAALCLRLMVRVWIGKSSCFSHR
jgi:hypothetical protein